MLSGPAIPPCEPAPSPAAAALGVQSHSSRQRFAYILWVLLLLVAGGFIRFKSIYTGFVADDYAQLAMLDGNYPLPRSAWNLFNFSDGSTEQVQVLQQHGFYPWWAAPNLRLSMMRPLASGMIWLDNMLFGNDAVAYHLHSYFWWSVMVAVVALLFWQLLPVPVAWLASLFFVADEAHTMPLSWLANRCALLGICLGAGALLAYLRYYRSVCERPQTVRRPPWLAISLFCLALGFGEYAFSFYGFFLAHACLVDQGPWRARVRAQLGLWMPGLLFLLLKVALGMGPKHSRVYLDPFSHPLEFLHAAVQRFPIMFADMLFAARADYWTYGFRYIGDLYQAGWVGLEWLQDPKYLQRTHVILGCIALAIVVVAAWRTLRRHPGSALHWLLPGAVLSLLPLLASFPSTRLLLVPLFGFCPLLATWVLDGIGALRTALAERSGLRKYLGFRWWKSAIAAGLACVLLAVHTLFAGFQGWQDISELLIGHEAIRRSIFWMPLPAETLPEQDLLIVASLEGGLGIYIPFTRQRYGLAAPRSARVLSMARGRHVLRRVSPTAFELSVLDGFTMLSTAAEALMRAPGEEYRVGDQIPIGEMRVTIMQLLRNRPVRIRVDLPVPLEEPAVQLVYPTFSGLQLIIPPAPGQYMILPAPAIPFGTLRAPDVPSQS